MNFLSFALVLLLEQWKPLPYARAVKAPFCAWARFLEKHCHLEDPAGGWVGVLVAVGIPLVVLLLLCGIVSRWGALPALLVNVLLLYWALGFARASRHYNDISLALREGRLDAASATLADWQAAAELPTATTGHSTGDIARQSIEAGLATTHRHVLAALFWFLVLGPAGAALYRLSALTQAAWPARAAAERLFWLIDWLPRRLTALSFAVVGDFVDAWRGGQSFAGRWAEPWPGIALGAGAGALGVQLGVAPPGNETDFGHPADAGSLLDAGGLIWRAVALWLALLLLLALAHLAD
jgi:cobalamin biosynthesis protein CobD/CbiB